MDWEWLGWTWAALCLFITTVVVLAARRSLRDSWPDDNEEQDDA